MRHCRECQQAKPASEFYQRRAACKECVRAKVRAHRAANIAAVRAYDRARADLPHRVALRKAITADVPTAKRLEYNARHWAKHPEARKARNIVAGALYRGKLQRGPCERCGAPKTQAHHDDYGRPLEVRWLCTPCHAVHHKQARESERAFRPPVD